MNKNRTRYGFKKDSKISLEQQKQMRGYLKPEPWGENEIKTSMTLSVWQSLGDYRRGIVEDIERHVIDTWMDLVERDVFYIPSMFIREVKTRYIREQRRAMGLNLDGSIPKNGRNLYIQNIYDLDGEIVYNIDKDKLPYVD